MDHPLPLTADTLLRGMRGSGALRRARIDRRGRRDARHIIVGIGQIHPVLNGRFSRFTARRIAAVQAWIYRCADALCRDAGVTRFGQEGFGGQDARVEEGLLKTLQQRLANGADAAMRRTSDAWLSALRRGSERAAADEAALLNGLALLQAQNSSVAVFGIEDAGIHGAVGIAVDRLHEEIERSAASSAYRMGMAKEGKRLTKEEYTALQRHGALVQAYNAALASPERDRAMFQRIVERSGKEPLTVFVLGQAHRRGFLRLARRHLPADVAFLWITPPQLWWLSTMLQRIAWGAGFALIAAGLWQLAVS